MSTSEFLETKALVNAHPDKVALPDKVLPISSHEINKWLSHFENLRVTHGFSFSSSWVIPSSRSSFNSTDDSHMSPGSTCDGVWRHENDDDSWPSKGVEESCQDESYSSSFASGIMEPHSLETGLIGQGSFGRVYKINERLTGVPLAYKSVPKRTVIDGVKIQDNVPRLAREIRCLESLVYHPAVVDLISVRVDDDMVHLVMPFYEGGDLAKRLKQMSRFNEPDSAMICASVASALAHAHGRRIMHRDIKLENILLKSTESNTDICVADFGLATFFEPGKPCSDFVGTSTYVSPNVIEQCYGPETDLWSLGVVLYTLLKGSLPFCGKSEVEILRSIAAVDGIDFSCHPWPTISEQAKSLISALLQRDEAKRITAAEVLCHPWIIHNVSRQKLKDLSDI